MDTIKIEPEECENSEDNLFDETVTNFYANHEVKVEIKEEEISDVKIESQVVDAVDCKNTVLKHNGDKLQDEEKVIIKNESNDCNHAIISLVHKETGQLPYECDVCGKVFTWKSSLRSHMILHKGIKKFVCDICNESFLHGRQLKRHMFVHTGVKPLSCQFCGKSFFENHQVSSHVLKVHAATKGHSFTCNICFIPFSSDRNLQRHMLNHSGNSTYPI